jgi:hypothetical protein
MEDLNVNICKVLQEMTDYNIESVSEMETGFLLANLLQQVDSDEFSSKDKTLNNWQHAKDRLEHFLSSKGLINQNLDFELPAIRKGEPQAIVSALLQIFAILAAFNPSNWERIINCVNYIAKVTIMKFLETMIADIREEIKFSRSASKGSHFDSPDDMRVLLHKLERHEATIDSQQASIAELKAELEKEYQEKQKVSRALEEKNKEILEMQQIKNEALKLLECNYVSKREEDPGEGLNKKIVKLNHEIDALNEKLLESRSTIIDKENEIDKLRLMQAFLEEKKTELEETNEQLSYYKKLTDNMKKEKEIYDSKLKCFEYADKNISKLKDLLKEEKQTAITFKLRSSEQEQTIAALQRRLGNSEDKVTIMKKSYLGNQSSSDSNEVFFQTNYLKDLEEENARLKQQTRDLNAQLNEQEMKNFTDELKEKETELMRSQIKSLLIENDHLTVQKAVHRKRYSHSIASIDPNDLELNHLLNLKEENESVILQNVKTGDFSWERDDDEPKVGLPSPKLDDFGLIYTCIMNYGYRELLRDRLLVPGRPERTRDILRPFALPSQLLAPKE